MSLLEICSCSFTYPQNKTAALRDINLKIQPGEYVAVVGKNGCGKSTLARMMAGFFKPDCGTVKLSEGVLAGIVFQQPKEQIVAAVVERDTAFGPQNLLMSKDEIELRTIECLSVTGLADRALSGTYELSLGQTQRLAFSGILAMFPNLLILDEVTAMLDPAARDELNAFIRQWNGRGCTVVHVTHDVDEAFCASRIVALENGGIVFDGSLDEFKKTDGIYKSIFGDFCLDELSALKNKNPASGEVVLSAEDISFSYKNREVFSHVNFSLRKGTLVSLTGSSGCGKSTLFECLSSLLKISSGSIKSAGRPVLALQECEASLFERYAADDVAFGPRNKKISGAELVKRVQNSMDMAALPFSQYANRGTFYLSGGEKRKLSIAALIALDEDILIFDEPTSALDCTSRKAVLKTLRKLADSGKTVLFSTHRMDEETVADVNLRWNEICSQNKEPLLKESSLPVLEVHKNASVIESLKKTAAAFSSPAALPRSVISILPSAVKLVLYIVLLGFSIFSAKPVICAAMLGVCVMYALFARYSILKPLKAIKTLLPIIIIFAILQFMFYPVTPDDTVLWQKGIFCITDKKIFFAVRMLVRSCSAIFATGTFLYTTKENEIVEGLEILLKPLALIKIPVRYFILVVSVVFRFMPLLLDEFIGIIKTQIIRGSFSNAKGLKKIKVIISVFLPLLFQSFRKAQFLADAFTARYFK